MTNNILPNHVVLPCADKYRHNVTSIIPLMVLTQRQLSSQHSSHPQCDTSATNGTNCPGKECHQGTWPIYIGNLYYTLQSEYWVTGDWYSLLIFISEYQHYSSLCMQEPLVNMASQCQYSTLVGSHSPGLGLVTMAKQDIQRTTAPSASRDQKMQTLAMCGHFIQWAASW